MLKRIAALTAALVLALAVMTPAMGAVEGVKYGIGEAAVPELESSNYIQVATVVGTTTSLDYKYYAFLREPAADTSKLVWKEIKLTDLTLDGKLNLSTVVNRAGVLILTDETDRTKLATNTSVVKVGSHTSLYAYYDILPPAPKIRLDKVKYNVTGNEGRAAWTSTMTSYEYASSGSLEWHTLTSMGFEVRDHKQDFLVRTKASADGKTGPSPTVKLSIPAFTAAPVVKVDTVKGLYAGKANYQVFLPDDKSENPNGYGIAELSGKGKLFTLASSTKNIVLGDNKIGGTECGQTISAQTVLWVRVPPTEKKPPSPWVRVDFSTAAVLGASEPPTADVFEMGAKRVVAVTGGVVIEYKRNGKWTKIKSFKAVDLENGKTQEIRTAGSKLKWPSESRIIKVEDGQVKVEPVPVEPTPAPTQP